MPAACLAHLAADLSHITPLLHCAEATHGQAGPHQCLGKVPPDSCQRSLSAAQPVPMQSLAMFCPQPLPAASPSASNRTATILQVASDQRCPQPLASRCQCRWCNIV